MLEIDAFFLNEDRHTNNIAVIYQEGTQQYALSPLFDQGLCLLADVKMDYPLELPLGSMSGAYRRQNHFQRILMSSWKRQKRYMESSFNFTSLLKRCKENWIRSRKGILMRFGSGWNSCCASRDPKTMPT